MAISQGRLAYQRRFCRAQCKDKEEKVDRRRGEEYTAMYFANSTRAAEEGLSEKGLL